MKKSTSRARRAFATFMVLWVIAVAVVAVAAVQAASFRQAAAGREALARVRAFWAARAGVEATIAAMAAETDRPDPDDPMRIEDEMAAVAEGTLEHSSYAVLHSEDGVWGAAAGPADAHSRMNVSALPMQSLMALPYMTEDIAMAIQDWVDTDDDVRPMGAEVTYYQSLKFPIDPRNAPMRHLLELEAIPNVRVADVRGEDWNFNLLLDASEADGDASWPPDNGDGRLDGEWSGLLTAVSRDGGLTASGEARIELRGAKAGALSKRLGVSDRQARVIATYMSYPSSQMRDLIRQDLRRLRNEATDQPIDRNVDPLTLEQMRALIDECVTEVPDGFRPGKININSAPIRVLELIPVVPESVMDAIISERQARKRGFKSLADLLDVPGVRREHVAALTEVCDVRSTVYVATSRGRDDRTGIEVELSAVLDRSTLPVIVQEVQVR